MDSKQTGLNGEGPRVVILAAGAPHFGNLATPTQEALLGETLLDLTVGGLRNLGITEICVVTGDKAGSFRRKDYRNIEIIHNAKWREHGRLSSILLGAQGSSEEILVLYGDTLFREDAVRRVLDAPGDFVIGIDEFGLKSGKDSSSPKDWGYETVRFDEPRPIFESSLSPASDCPELAGIFLFRDRACRSLRSMADDVLAIREQADESFLAGLSEIATLVSETKFVDVSGLRAEIRSAVDIPTFVLGSKSRALRILRPLLKKSTIQDQLVTRRDTWATDGKEVCHDIIAKFGVGTPLIIRSSASGEDGFLSSQAGAHLSRLDVVGYDNLRWAIEEVFSSYGNEIADDEVLIQPMVNRVLFSGVCLTRTLTNHAPWYVITYTNDGATDSVTSGRGNAPVTRMVSRDSRTHDSIPDEIRQLLSAISEIEDIVHFSALDIEFAVDEEREVHIFQVRPLAGFLSDDPGDISGANAARSLASLEWNERASYEIFGTQIQPFMSNMSDWNPAEMIGENPETLAQTLYANLLTNETWAVQRFEVGFHDFRRFRLMTSFYGRPYIDTRLSLGSFIPRSVGEKTAAKVLKFSIETLRKNPHLHDKIEFDVAPTCIDLNWSKWQDAYTKTAGLSERELGKFEDGLLEATRRTLSIAPAALRQVNCLDDELAKLGARPQDTTVAQTLDLVRALGALPFAHLARSGFVSVSILRSGILTGLLSAAAVSDFFSSLHTISAQLLDDAYSVKTGEKNFDDYVKTFGHLRPGTYDLKSPRYDSSPNLFLQPLIDRAAPRISVVGRIWDDEKSRFLEELVRQGIFSDSISAEKALRLGITGREHGKFIYSKGVSCILEKIETLGRNLGIEAHAMAKYPITQILAIEEQGTTEVAARILRGPPKAEPARQNGFSSPVVMSPDDFHHYIELLDQPNFIGLSAAIGPVVFLSGNERDAELFGTSPMIVLIERADPGFDWIFGKQIAGLITQFGGANSHMAIRTAEFGIPAAIGVGRRKFDELRLANLVEINPDSQVVRKVT